MFDGILSQYQSQQLALIMNAGLAYDCNGHDTA
jgi:hypothetical protein